MIEFDDFTQNIEPFLSNIISNPDYNPSSEEFLKVTFDIYSSTTIHPERSYTKNEIDENPFNNPFERVFNLLLDYSKQQFDTLDFKDNKIVLHHLYSVKQRIKIINHAFRYLNKQIPSFILNANQCKFGYQISLCFFMAFEKYYDMLLLESINSITSIFDDPNSKDYKTPDFTYLINLSFICLLASKAMESSDENTKTEFNSSNHNNVKYNQIYEIYGHNKIIEKLKKLFVDRKNTISIDNLPIIVEHFYQFLRLVKNPSTKIELYDLLYEYAIEKFVDSCNTKIFRSHKIIIKSQDENLKSQEENIIIIDDAFGMIENRQYEEIKNDLRYLRILSFNSLTKQCIEQFFNKYLDGLSNILVKESSISNLATIFIHFLDDIDFFNELMYEDIFNNERKKFDKFFLETSKNKLKNITFKNVSTLDGNTFSIVLSSIIDHFMKKGNNLSNKQTSNAIDLNIMTKLVTYVSDRDVFLTHHSNYMFIRIATRSTISIKNEKKFLETVQNVVKNTMNFTNAFELIEQAETEFLETMTRSAFNYYVIRHIYAPANRQFPRVPLPSDYKNFITMSEKSLAQKWQGRKYEWLHYLTTLNVRISKNKRYILLTMSLGQFAVFSALFKNPNLTKKDIHEITNIDGSYLDTIFNSFRNANFIKPYKNKVDNQNPLPDDTRISLDESFMPKQVVNLCDNWTPQYAPKVKNLEVQAQRKKSVQAVIVQIMKKFKMLQTQQLVDLVTIQISNLYEVKDEEVMAAIRELVADEYLEETDGGAQLGYIE